MPKPTATQIANWERRKALAKALKRRGYTFAEIGRVLRVTRQRAAQMASGWR